MKLDGINRQQQNGKQSFKGDLGQKAADFLTKHPKAPSYIAGLAGSSVIAQKIVMSGSEAVVGPAMDVAIGKSITKLTDEKDGRTNQSSKVQAIRTFSQSVGGTITGVIIRGACIAASTYALGKLGTKAGSKIGKLVSDGLTPDKNLYKYKEKMSSWGKSLGGAIAIGIMLFTNFIIDAPFINKINKKTTDLVDNFSEKRKLNKEKEAQNG